MNSLLKKLGSQTLVYGLPAILGRFLNFLLVSLHTRSLPDTPAYGAVSLMFAYASLAAIFFTFGMETAFFNFARSSDNPKKVFSTGTLSVLLVGIGLSMIAFLFQNPIMTAIGYPQKPEFAWWFAIILAADAITAMCFAWLRFVEKPAKYAIIRFFNILVNIGLNLFFLVYCPAHQHENSWISGFFNSEKMVDYIFISNFIASLIILPLFFPTLKNLVAGIDKSLLKKMLAYGSPMIIIGTAGMVNETFDRIMLKEILPPAIADAENGIYSAYYKLSLIITLFIHAFRMAAEPLFFKAADKADAQKNYARIMKWFVYFCGFAAIFTMVFLPLIMEYLFGATYRNNARGLSVVPILLMANIFLGMYYNVSVWYKINNRVKSGAVISVFAAILTLTLNWIFIGKYSFIACAFTTLAAYLFMFVVGWLWGKRVYPVPYDMTRITFTLIITAGFVFGLYFWNPSSMLLMFPALIAYGMLIFLLEKIKLKTLK